MALPNPRDLRTAPERSPTPSSAPDEARFLLSDSDDESDALVVHRGDGPVRSGSPSPSVSPGPGSGVSTPNLLDGRQRQSSLARPRPQGAPRTPNRVRFEVERDGVNGSADAGGPGARDSIDWMEEEDYLGEMERGRRNSSGQRLPLLTDIEAPSVTLATGLEEDPEEYLESAKPRSNVLNAFMNMANSIM